MIYRPINSAIKLYLNLRFRRIEEMRSSGVTLQQEIRKELWNLFQNTAYVRQCGATSLEQMPIIEYDEVKSYIDRMMLGEDDVLIPEQVNWYSKSSGTTSDRSKYIPVSEGLFQDNIIASSWDTTSIIYNRWKDATLFSAKSLIMGGSLTSFEGRPEVQVGDVSAIMIKRIPAIGKPFYAPSPDIALVSDWDEKIAKIINTTLEEDVVMFGGVPTWNIVLFDKILDHTGKNNILEVWPNLNVYVHGGVSFAPYKQRFKEYIPKDDFNYVEVYNASEGYFAVQDRDEEGMLLLLDNGIYYEFIPLHGMDDPMNNIIRLADVRPGEIYTMVITTLGGLVRYMPGDTVEFLSTNPYRIRVSGRTAQYINAFGEEVMVSNTDDALSDLTRQFGLKVIDYTVAPRYFNADQQGCHEWIIEFEQEVPEDQLEAISDYLDNALRKVNSDYDAKRFKNMALSRLKLNVASRGTFHRWLAAKNKLGGQNKVPRLSNERTYIDEILNYL